MTEENQQSSSNLSSTSTQTKNTLMKDLLIPFSIVIAGMFIGAGLYFGGAQPVAKVAGDTQPENSGNPILALALKAGVDEDDFTACFENGETLSAVEDDLNNAVATGGRGTPWGIIIGPSGKKYPINGAIPQQSIEQLIELAKSESNDNTNKSEEELALDKMSPVTNEDHIKGSMDAPVMIVEYSDFDCPFCARFHGVMNTIVKKYDGEVAWVYRHFPLEQLHPNAKAVSVASECVAKLGGNEAFWVFTDGYLAGR